MARQTFFTFRYRNDGFRAGVVRNSWVTQDRKASGFFDSADWESVKKKDDATIEKWIDGQLVGTTVTAVLIGADTYGKKWINYEITSSHKRGNGLLGIYIYNIKHAPTQSVSAKGKNPFDQWTFKRDGSAITIPVYDWVDHDGYKNMGSWIEKAATAAGR